MNNTTIQKLSLRQQATDRELHARQVLIAADRAYQADRTPKNMARLQRAIAAHRQAKADAEAAGYSYKYGKNTELA